jgi:hypothetical protein
MVCRMIFVLNIHVRSHSRTQSLCRLFFGVSALTFRCKPPLGASSPFISAVSAFIFCCKPPLGASSPLFRRYHRLFFTVSSAFPLERLLSRKLTLRSLRNDFLLLRQRLAMCSLKRLFVASSKLLDLRRFLRKVYYIMIMTKLLQEIEINKRTKLSMVALY